MDKTIKLSEILSKVWIDKKKITIYASLGLVVGCVVAFSIPKEYKSAVKFATELKGGESNKNSMVAMAAMMGVNMGNVSQNGINEKVYPEIIKSAMFLLEFREMTVRFNGQFVTLENYLAHDQKRAWWSYVFGLPSMIFGERSEQKDQNDPLNPSMAQRNFESSLSARIFLEKDPVTDILKLDVKMQDPYIATQVADTMVVVLQKYMSNYYTSKARQELEQSEEMLEEAKQNYYITDNAYAITVDKNLNLISQYAMTRIERLKNDRDMAQTIYAQLANQVEFSRIKLFQETPIATIIEPARMPLNAASPNKKLIVIAWIFLFGFGRIVFDISKILIKEREN